MKRIELCEILNDISDDLIIKSESISTKRNRVWIKLIAVAACLCLAITVGLKISKPERNTRPVLQWHSAFMADEYFKYSKNADQTSNSISNADIALPYKYSRSFTDIREQMESEEIIPILSEYSDFSCTTSYNDDGSIYKVSISWNRRSENDISVYSDLNIIAAPQEIEILKDCIIIELDKDGNIIPDAITVIQRDGIQIVTEGKENSEKTITFKNKHGWYRITGSWNDSYESVVALLDWLWENPINVNWFSAEKGCEITYENLQDNPSAFKELIPDFESLGYIMESGSVKLKDGKPISCRGRFYSGLGTKDLKNTDFYLTKYWTRIDWQVEKISADNASRKIFANLKELNEETVNEKLFREKEMSFEFKDHLITVSFKGCVTMWPDVWPVFKSLLNE